MKRAILVAGVAAACLALGGCATGNTDPAAVLKALGDTYAHCERIVTYQASVGALNPASGATISGQVRCPPREAPAVPPTAPPGGT